MMMKSHVNGNMVFVEFVYTPGEPFRQTGWGAGDCEPDEQDEIEIHGVYDMDGANVTRWATDADWERLLDECITHSRSV